MAFWFKQTAMNHVHLILPPLTAHAARRHPGEPRSHQRLSDRADENRGKCKVGVGVCCNALIIVALDADTGVILSNPVKMTSPPTHAPNNKAYRCYCCTLNIAGRGGITPKRLHDRKGGRGKHMHTHACTRTQRDEQFVHLLSRQQIHSADGDVFGDVCTATIFPGRVTVEAAAAAVRCYRRRLPGRRAAR